MKMSLYLLGRVDLIDPIQEVFQEDQAGVSNRCAEPSHFKTRTVIQHKHQVPRIIPIPPVGRSLREVLAGRGETVQVPQASEIWNAIRDDNA